MRGVLHVATIIASEDARLPDPFVIHPGSHPGAHAWPHGMVIAPPVIDPHFNQLPGLVDNVLSGLLAALRALVL